MLTSLPEHLRNRVPTNSTRSGLVAEIEEIAGARSALDAYEHRVVSAIDALGDKGLDAAGVLRSVAHVSSRAASRVSSTAAGMSELPSTAEALASGAITAEHANVIADAATLVAPDLVDAELVAKASATPADLFAKRTREWVAGRESDTDIALRHQRQTRLRSVKSWTDRDGMSVWLARLDPVTAAAVSARLNAEYERLWNDDGGRDIANSSQSDRNPEQRMADAFAALVVSAADTRATQPAPRPHPRRQMLVVADISRMRSDDPDGLASVIDGTPLPQAVLERLSCNSDLTGVLFDGPARPIWVGRTSRHATIAQWKALIARDRGCVGCGAAPDRCEAHHINPWNRHGNTDITNLVLVCSRCHHDIHDRGMELSKSTDGGWKITPRAGPTLSPIESHRSSGFEENSALRCR